MHYDTYAQDKANREYLKELDSYMRLRIVDRGHHKPPTRPKQDK